MIANKSKHIKYHEITSINKPFKLECGKNLDKVELAYETFGKMNKDKTNIILILHAFSGDSHVGTYEDEPQLKGWWSDFVGKDKIFDTTKYCILCSNVIGGCMGSTGPRSINPKTGHKFNLDFPIITIKDIVNAQVKLIEKLGIKKLLSVCGGSMGGMQAIEWAVSHSEKVKSCIFIATTNRLSPQGIAFNEVGRRAIINDPKWNKGNYSDNNPPNEGLSLARMIAHITYLSDESMRNKFGRSICNENPSNTYELFDSNTAFQPKFEVETYLDYQGEKFTKRFDANTYLYLSKAIDYFDIEQEYGSLVSAFEQIQSKILLMTFESDWLYPIYQGKYILNALQQAGKDVTYCEIQSNYGHDAFLLEYDKMAPILISFLKSIKKNN